jgi:hypothetical protein
MKPAASKTPAKFPGTQLVATLNGSERRSSLRLFKHWEAARRSASLPKLGDFDLSLLEELGDSSFLLMLGEFAAEPTFRYFGRDLASQIGRDLTGRSIADVPAASLLSRVMGHYLEAIQQRKAVGVSGRCEPFGGDDLVYRGILLPFSSDAGEVNAVLGCYRSRPYKGSARAALDRAASGAAPLVLGPEQLEAWYRPGNVQALKALARKLAWPRRALSTARAAAPLGRAVVRLDAPLSEFVLLLARRTDPQSDRFDVVSATGPLLLNLALRQAASRLARDKAGRR